MRTALVMMILWAGAAYAQSSLFEQANALHQEGFKQHDAAKLAHAHELYAAKMYERVTTLAPKGKFGGQAAYSFVVCAKNAVKPASRDGGPPCPDMKPCAIPPDRQRPERPNIECRKAKLLSVEVHNALGARTLWDGETARAHVGAPPRRIEHIVPSSSKASPRSKSANKAAASRTCRAR